MQTMLKNCSQRPQRTLACLISAAWVHGVVSAAPSAKTPIDVVRVQQCLHAAAKQHNHAPALLFAIAEQESGFNPAVVGYTGIAYGLMQIYWDVHKASLSARGIELSDLYDPCINAEVGAGILRAFMSQYGENWKAVGAYYAGNKLAREADRQWYANEVAKKVTWYQKHGTDLTKVSNLAYRGHVASASPRLVSSSRTASSIRAQAAAARQSTLVAWELKP